MCHSRNAVGYVFKDFNDHKIVFSGDTMPCEQLVNYGMDATLLVHEATFADDEEVHHFQFTCIFQLNDIH